METLILLAKKLVGMGVLGTVTLTGVGAAQDGFDAVKDFFLISATQIEMGECEKVITSFYIRDNRFPTPGDELWNWFAENYPEDQIPELKTDGWFTPYQFITDKFMMQSAGPDKKLDTRDDLAKRYPKLANR